MADEMGRRAAAPGGGARAWRVTGVALVGMLFVSALGVGVDPALARTCGTVTIHGGTASPGSGTTATSFAFAVEFTDTTGAAPTSVTLRIAGTSTALHATETNFAAGVLYKGSRKLPAGTWPYFFRATFGDGQTCDNIRVTPTSVTVAAAPTPTP